MANAGDLNLMHWNINYFKNKLHHVASYPGILHIIAISETWLTPLNFPTFRLRDYHETHSVRQNSKGGGLSVFVHSSICVIAPKTLVDVITPDLNHYLILELPSAVPYRRVS